MQQDFFGVKIIIIIIFCFWLYLIEYSREPDRKWEHRKREWAHMSNQDVVVTWYLVFETNCRPLGPFTVPVLIRAVYTLINTIHQFLSPYLSVGF